MIRTLFSLLAVALCALQPVEAVAADEVRVCVELPSGTLQVKTAALGASSCPTLATPFEVVGVWVFWTQGVSQFADEYSGHELFGCFDSSGDTVIQQRDTSGADKGTKRKTYTPAAAPVTGLVSLPDAVADTAAAGQVQWIVKGGGSGGAYNTALSSCRTLVGYPPA